MAKYIESNLGPGEVVLVRAQKSNAALLWRWVFGIIFSWMLLIPLFMAISASLRRAHLELVITNKRVMGRAGGISTTTMDYVLSKVTNVSVLHTLCGRMSNYGTIEIASATDSFIFQFVKNADDFKNKICAYQEMAENGTLPTPGAKPAYKPAVPAAASAAPKPAAPAAAPAAPKPATPAATPAAPKPATPAATPAAPKPVAPAATPAAPKPATPAATPAAPKPATPAATPAAPKPADKPEDK